MKLGLWRNEGYESWVLLKVLVGGALTGIVIGEGGATSDSANLGLVKGFPACAGGGV